jgi:hypothetical protein
MIVRYLPLQARGHRRSHLSTERAALRRALATFSSDSHFCPAPGHRQSPFEYVPAFDFEVLEPGPCVSLGINRRLVDADDLKA